MKKAKVLVCCRSMHATSAAKALDDLGYDVTFLSGFITNNHFFSYLPILQRRFYPELGNINLKRFVLQDILEVSLSFLKKTNLISQSKYEFIADSFFDFFTALFFNKKYDILHCFLQSSRRSSNKARKLNKLIILEDRSNHFLFKSDILRNNCSSNNLFKDTKKQIIDWNISLENSNCLVVQSPFSKEIFLKYQRTFSKEIFVIEPGIQFLRDNSHHKKKSIKNPTDALTLLYVGRIECLKGLESFIGFIESHQDLNFNLWLVGSNYIKRSTDPRIEYFGQLSHDKLIPLYKAADIFVFPSFSDSWSFSVAEAIIYNCIPIVSENTGAKKLVKHGHNGFIVDPYSHSDIYIYLQKLSNDKNYFEKIKRNLKNSNFQDLDFSSYKKKIELCYQKSTNEMLLQQKVIILTEIISPYRIPLFNMLASKIKNLEIVFFRNSNFQRQWTIEHEKLKFKYLVLKGFTIKTKYGSPLYVSFGLLKKLFIHRPNIIIAGGYNNTSFLYSLIYSKITKTKFLIWFESTESDYRINSRVIQAIKKRLISFSDGFIVPGQASLNYIMQLGLGNKPIYIARNSINTKLFKINKKYKKGKNHSFLCVSRIEKHKGIKELVLAFEKILKDGFQAELKIIGVGSNLNEIKELISTRKIPNVYLLGHKSQEELVEFYSKSHVFVMPSFSDPWGLVVNEAQACSLPVICSNKAGCAIDLIDDNLNGLLFDPYGDLELYNTIKKFLTLPSIKKEEMAKLSYEKSIKYSPEITTNGFIEAIKGQCAE